MTFKEAEALIAGYLHWKECFPETWENVEHIRQAIYRHQANSLMRYLKSEPAIVVALLPEKVQGHIDEYHRAHQQALFPRVPALKLSNILEAIVYPTNVAGTQSQE